MKKFIINYYAIITMILFITYNLILEDLKIGGSLYILIMFLLIIVNVIVLIVFKEKIKFKSLVIIIYSFVWIFSKNKLQCLFDFSNIIILCIIGFDENDLIKAISILIITFTLIYFLPFFYIFLLSFGTGFNEERGINDIYDNTHFYCDNNYEVYSYSAGAMDSFHYSIGKYYEILNLGDIIYISYRERNEKTQEEYERYLKKHNCSLVGDNNGFK